MIRRRRNGCWRRRGIGPSHPLKLKFMISTSGSGQMYPQSMNEFVQQNFADVGVVLEFELLEWQALRNRRDAGGAAGPTNKGIDALNNSWGSMDPLSAFLRQVDSKSVPPNGTNWGFIDDPELDVLCKAAREEFDVAKQDAILAKIHTRMVDQADWIFVVHDVNPRAVSPTGAWGGGGAELDRGFLAGFGRMSLGLVVCWASPILRVRWNVLVWRTSEG